MNENTSNKNNPVLTFEGKKYNINPNNIEMPEFMNPNRNNN